MLAMAVTNLREFTLGMEAAKKQATERRRKLTRAVGLEALRGVVLSTRVDTGRARGNWQAQEGSPPVGEIERNDMAGSQGTADTIAAESGTVLSATGDDVLWLHNGVPYIGILEDLDKMLAGTVSRLRLWIRSQLR